MKRNIYIIALVILALVAGAAVGVYNARRQVIAEEVVADQVADAGTATELEEVEAAVVETPGPVVIPEFTPIKHNAASTPEALAVNAVNAFEAALNTKDANRVQGLYADGVDISQLPLALAALKTRPVSASITSTEVRADESVLIYVSEQRQNEAGEAAKYDRVFELTPRESDYAVAGYMLVDNLVPTSGLAD